MHMHSAHAQCTCTVHMHMHACLERLEACSVCSCCVYLFSRSIKYSGDIVPLGLGTALSSLRKKAWRLVAKVSRFSWNRHDATFKSS